MRSGSTLGVDTCDSRPRIQDTHAQKWWSLVLVLLLLFQRVLVFRAGRVGCWRPRSHRPMLLTQVRGRDACSVATGLSVLLRRVEWIFDECGGFPTVAGRAGGLMLGGPRSLRPLKSLAQVRFGVPVAVHMRSACRALLSCGGVNRPDTAPKRGCLWGVCVLCV